MRYDLRYWLLRVRDWFRHDRLHGCVPLDTVIARYERDPKRRASLARATERLQREKLRITGQGEE
jgi:hypothetical protein